MSSQLNISDILELQVSGTSLYLRNNEIAEEINWVIDNTQEIRVYTTRPGVFVIKIIDEEENTIEQVALTRLTVLENLENDLYCYGGISKVAKLLKSGTRIKIGLVYADTLEQKGVVTTIPLTINLINSIGVLTVSSEELIANKEVIEQLLTIFGSGKAIEGLEIKDESGEKFLYAQYAGQNYEKAKIGKVSSSLEELGIRNKNNSEGNPGGGQLGYGAKATGGFAGGKNAQTTHGAAIGLDAKSVNGVALGQKANSIENNSIAIGTEAYIKSASSALNSTSNNGNIAIGSGALVKWPDAKTPYGNIGIGTNVNVQECQRSIVIGSSETIPSGKDWNDNKNIYTSIKMPFASMSRYTNNAVVVGSGAYAMVAKQPIILGANAAVIGVTSTTKSSGYKPSYAIAIGSAALSRASGGIAIGHRAIVGAEAETGKIYTSNKALELAGKQINAIAIGERSKARRLNSIAIGSQAHSCYQNNIAIGFKAIAGNPESIKKYEKKSPYDAEVGGAIAIGSNSYARSPGSVQIGPGENTRANSLKFQNVEIVKNGKVCVNLSNSEHTGVLPVSKGGTGAENKGQALKNLGIYSGSLEFYPDNDAKSTRGKEYEIITFKDNKGKNFFKKPPRVILSYRSLASKLNPSLHHFMVTEVTKDYCKIQYKYSGDSKIKAGTHSPLKLYIDYVAFSNG